MSFETREIWLVAVILAAAAASYLWRGLGVWLSGRIAPDGAALRWVTCVSYAMLAALVARMIVLPEGPLLATALADRLIACALALGAFFATRRSVLAGVAAGTATLAILTALRSAGLT